MLMKHGRLLVFFAVECLFALTLQISSSAAQDSTTRIDRTTPDELGDTPLMASLKRDDTATAMRLLQGGSPINQANKEGVKIGRAHV